MEGAKKLGQISYKNFQARASRAKISNKIFHAQASRAKVPLKIFDPEQAELWLKPKSQKWAGLSSSTQEMTIQQAGKLAKIIQYYFKASQCMIFEHSIGLG